MPLHHIIPLHEWKIRINPLADRYDPDFNEPDNTVWLTLKQHAQAHLFLFELHANKYDWVAYSTLSGQMTMASAKKEAQREAGRRTGNLNKLPQRRIENRQRNLERYKNPETHKMMRVKCWDICSKKLKGVPKSESHKAAMRGLRPHVNQTGGDNNNARRIETPYGSFGSIADAARELNLSRGQVTRIIL